MVELLGSSFAAPAMWPRKSVGEGTLADSGIEATQALEKRGSEVSCAMASIEPGSAVSDVCAQIETGESSHTNAIVSNRFIVGFIASIVFNSSD
jgi:hypothetical protein